MQAANYEADASGIHDGEYQLTKHEFSSLGQGKYSGTQFMLALSTFLYILSFSISKYNTLSLNKKSSYSWVHNWLGQA